MRLKPLSIAAFVLIVSGFLVYQGVLIYKQIEQTLNAPNPELDQYRKYLK